MYKIRNIELEKVNVRSEPAFYWGNSPLNFMGQNPGGESFPTFPSGGYAHGELTYMASLHLVSTDVCPMSTDVCLSHNLLDLLS